MVDWITEQVATSGAELTAESWRELREETGITAVVNLRSEYQDVFDRPFPIAYLWLPVIDFTDPEPDQMLMAARFIDTAVAAGRRVLVHCRLGIGRSPTVVAAWLIYTGLPAPEAIRRIEEAPRSRTRPVISRTALDRFSAILPEVP
jgi:protein-tyrosine phosphatase